MHEFLSSQDLSRCSVDDLVLKWYDFSLKVVRIQRAVRRMLRNWKARRAMGLKRSDEAQSSAGLTSRSHTISGAVLRIQKWWRQRLIAIKNKQRVANFGRVAQLKADGGQRNLVEHINTELTLLNSAIQSPLLPNKPEIQQLSCLQRFWLEKQNLKNVSKKGNQVLFVTMMDIDEGYPDGLLTNYIITVDKQEEPLQFTIKMKVNNRPNLKLQTFDGVANLDEFVNERRWYDRLGEQMYIRNLVLERLKFKPYSSEEYAKMSLAVLKSQRLKLENKESLPPERKQHFTLSYWLESASNKGEQPKQELIANRGTYCFSDWNKF